MKEIVAAQIGTLVTNNPRTILEATEKNTISEFLDRKRMEFMAAMDLGERWQKLADGPTLFCMDEAGKIFPPNA